MAKSLNDRPLKVILLAGLLVLAYPACGASPVYKCVAGGKTSFTTSLQNAMGDCQLVDVKVVEPNPVEAARQIEKNRVDAEEDAAKAAKLREDKKKTDDEALRRAERLQEARILSQAHTAAARAALAEGRRRSGGSYRRPY